MCLLATWMRWLRILWTWSPRRVRAIPVWMLGPECRSPVVAAGSSSLNILSTLSWTVLMKLVPENLCSGRPQGGSAGRWWHLDFRSWGCCVQKGLTWFLWGPCRVSVAQMVKEALLPASYTLATDGHNPITMIPSVLGQSLEPLWSGTVPWTFITMS